MTLLIMTIMFGPDMGSVEPALIDPAAQISTVSWYGPGFNGRPMANGQRFDQDDPTVAAHRDLPFGTIVRMRNRTKGKIWYLKIQDRGPFVRGRDFDVSIAAAQLLEIKEEGVAELETEVIFRPDP